MIKHQILSQEANNPTSTSKKYGQHIIIISHLPANHVEAKYKMHTTGINPKAELEHVFQWLLEAVNFLP